MKYLSFLIDWIHPVLPQTVFTGALASVAENWVTVSSTGVQVPRP